MSAAVHRGPSYYWNLYRAQLKVGIALMVQYRFAVLIWGVWGFVGPLISLTYVLTLEDPYRFKTSRDVGAYLGMVPRQRQSGEQDPELGITKAGNAYLRQLLIQGAHYIVGPYGSDCHLRRWALRRMGGKNARKRTLVAVARKLAVLLHRLWVTGEVYEPLRGEQREEVNAA